MAYWQNGKCYLYGSTQSQSYVIPALAALLQIEPEDLVYVSEFCGGGFGSKAPAYPVIAIPAYMARKTGRPVLMRISRAEENFIGVCRPAFQGRLKIGFQPDGAYHGSRSVHRPEQRTPTRVGVTTIPPEARCPSSTRRSPCASEGFPS